MLTPAADPSRKHSLINAKSPHDYRTWKSNDFIVIKVYCCRGATGRRIICRLLERAVGSIRRCRAGVMEPPTPAPRDLPGIRRLSPKAVVPHLGRWDIRVTGGMDGTVMPMPWMGQRCWLCSKHPHGTRWSPSPVDVVTSSTLTVMKCPCFVAGGGLRHVPVTSTAWRTAGFFVAITKNHSLGPGTSRVGRTRQRVVMGDTVGGGGCPFPSAGTGNPQPRLLSLNAFSSYFDLPPAPGVSAGDDDDGTQDWHRWCWW